MKNDVEAFSITKVTYDSNFIKSNKNKEKLNTRNFKGKMNYFLLLLFIILIIIIIIFFCLLFFKRKKLKNITINKTQIANNKIICESGYYLPLDDPLTKNCKKCSIDNCIECFGSKLKDICIKCNPEFKGVYINNKIESCEIPCEEGINEKCKKCDIDNNKCKSCNDSFYHIGRSNFTSCHSTPLKDFLKIFLVYLIQSPLNLAKFFLPKY